jgi:FkbM family methyltransferase
MSKVFIDGGAHKGEAIDVLLEKRPDLEGCEVHFFEPNPDLIELLEGIAKDNKKYDITVHHGALWVKDGEIDFLESIARWNTLASTIVPSMKEIWGLKLDRDNPKKVESISLSNFLDEFDDDEYIVLKLDVEGSEYYLLEQLINNKKINKIDELYIEWHDHFFPDLKDLGNKLRNQLSKLPLMVRNDWM